MRMTFVAAELRRGSLDVPVILTRDFDDLRFHRTTLPDARDRACRTRIRNPEDLDERNQAILCGAYGVAGPRRPRGAEVH